MVNSDIVILHLLLFIALQIKGITVSIIRSVEQEKSYPDILRIFG